MESRDPEDATAQKRKRTGQSNGVSSLPAPDFKVRPAAGRTSGQSSRSTLLGTIRRTSIFKTQLSRQRKPRLRVGALKRYLKEGPCQEDFLAGAKCCVHRRAGKQTENAGHRSRIDPASGAAIGSIGDQHRQRHGRAARRRPFEEGEHCAERYTIAEGCGSRQKTTTTRNRGGPFERCGSPGGNIRGELVELTWDSVLPVRVTKYFFRIHE